MVKNYVMVQIKLNGWDDDITERCHCWLLLFFVLEWYFHLNQSELLATYPVHNEDWNDELSLTVTMTRHSPSFRSALTLMQMQLRSTN